MTENHLYDPAPISQALIEHGFTTLAGSSYQQNAHLHKGLRDFCEHWSTLPPDQGLALVDPDAKPGEAPYRNRRFGQFRLHIETGELTPLPPAPFEQAYIAPGQTRTFAPLTTELFQSSTLQEFIRADLRAYRPLLPPDPTFVINVHMIRVVDGNPSPEGFHRDTPLLFSTRLIGLTNATGGVALLRSFPAKPSGLAQTHDCYARIQLAQPLDTYFIVDALFEHMATSIARIDPNVPAIRDVLILSFRKDTVDRRSHRSASTTPP